MDCSLTKFAKCYKVTNQGPPIVETWAWVKENEANAKERMVNSRKDVECYTNTAESSSSISGIDHSSVGNRGNREA